MYVLKLKHDHFWPIVLSLLAVDIILYSITHMYCNVVLQDRPLHILAIGRDTGILHKLLSYGLQFSQRAFVHSSGQHLTAKVTADQYIGAKYAIEGMSDQYIRVCMLYRVCIMAQYLHFQCFLLQWTQEKFWHSFFLETVPVTYESAVPAAVLNTALLCIKKRIVHSQSWTILIKYKYKDWILLVGFS